MLFISARRAKTANLQHIDAREKYLICKGSIFALLQSFFPYSNFSVLIRLLMLLTQK